MKRRSFIKGAAAITAIAGVTGPLRAQTVVSGKKELYEFRVYRFSGGGGVNQLKTYLTKAVIPLMNGFGVKVGAFGEYSLEEPPKINILFAYPDVETFFKIQEEKQTNVKYLMAAESYLKSDPVTPVFIRYETYLLEAFDKKPKMEIPDKNRGLFELRTYESYNEDAGKRKIEMFNKEEIPLFKKVGLHSVLFSKIIAGPQMPALMYMLWFKDMDERNTNWDKFRASEEWNIMKAKPEYANTVSTVNKKFLVPLDYSQI